MPQPPTAAHDKKRRQRMLIIGAGAVLVLVFVYMRSRSSSSANTSASSPGDAQSAFMQGAQQQAQQDAAMYGGQQPSTFADNGANSAALGDALTQGLSGVSTALSNFQTTPPSWWTQPAATAPDASSTPAATAPAAPAVTINFGGAGPAVGTGTAATSRTQTTRMSGGRAPSSGAIPAAFGPTRPSPKSGYNVVGTGSGNWWYVPKPEVKRTGETSAKQPARKK